MTTGSFTVYFLKLIFIFNNYCLEIEDGREMSDSSQCDDVLVGGDGSFALNFLYFYFSFVN